MKFVTPLSYQVTEASFEKKTGPSVTIKGQSYTVKDLMRRHIQGMMPAGIGRESYYEDQDIDTGVDFEKAANADLFEREQLKSELVEVIKANKEKIATAVKKGSVGGSETAPQESTIAAEKAD